jgi:hypothetical protein
MVFLTIGHSGERKRGSERTRRGGKSAHDALQLKVLFNSNNPVDGSCFFY